MKKTPFFVFSCFLLSGCALPLPVQIALWAADGVSYLQTEKSLSDHGLSLATGQDCAVWRILPEGRVCRDAPPDVLVAEAPAKDPEPMAAPLEPVEREVMETFAEAELVPLPEEIAFVTAAGRGPDLPEPEPEVATSDARLADRMFVLRDVNMRTEPSGRSRIIRALLRDEVAERVEDRNGWMRVRVGEPAAGGIREGWVDGRYLQAAG